MISLLSNISIVLAVLAVLLSVQPGNKVADLNNRIEKNNVTSSMQDTIEWEKPRFTERRKERHRMVERGIKGRGVTDEATLEAMRQVPRHLFVPEDRRSSAYENKPLPIGYRQTISQPYIVGYMTELLELEAGEKVLEIGTGSGYQAAILSEITPHVFTIEIVEELGIQARERFDSLGYHTIKTKIGDGYNGWSEHAPFDAIILTAAADEIPQPLIEQLMPGGVMVLPIGDSGLTQSLMRVRKTEDGEIQKERKLPVRFVPMTGIDQKN